VGWWDRVRTANAGARVTRDDQRAAMAALDEVTALTAERDRLKRDGLHGTATIVAIEHGVATSSIGTWHELTLDVHLPGRDTYRAARRVAVELSTAPHIAAGATVPVLVDPHDRSAVLIVGNP
jgi:hypothetical protein